ncbi:unnamed protein product [Polarella glacialis]|uniref:Protein kinase domain-containing protein n=1 Tax=Polarella glacialis TaxID=89957 RepID=A0A813FS82_POLGL|nr:unnamed protein product [Polarella glacialis]
MPQMDCHNRATRPLDPWIPIELQASVVAAPERLPIQVRRKAPDALKIHVISAESAGAFKSPLGGPHLNKSPSWSPTAHASPRPDVGCPIGDGFRSARLGRVAPPGVLPLGALGKPSPTLSKREFFTGGLVITRSASCFLSPASTTSSSPRLGLSPTPTASPTWTPSPSPRHPSPGWAFSPSPRHPSPGWAFSPSPRHPGPGVPESRSIPTIPTSPGIVARSIPIPTSPGIVARSIPTIPTSPGICALPSGAPSWVPNGVAAPATRKEVPTGAACAGRECLEGSLRLRLSGRAPDPARQPLLGQLLTSLGACPSATVKATDGIQGGCNEGIWFLKGGEDDLVLKLVKFDPSMPAQLLESENFLRLHQRNSGIACDPSVSFPVKILHILDERGARHYDLIVMRRALGQTLQEVISEKCRLRRQADFGSIFKNIGHCLAGFHSRYGGQEHCDFGPQNIMYDKDTDHVTLIDVGGMGRKVRSKDVDRFCEIIDMLASKYYGPELRDGLAYFKEGYSRAGLS